MAAVEGVRTKVLPREPLPLRRAEVSYSVGSPPLVRLERDQVEALAELITSRLWRAREDCAPDERKQFRTARQAAELLAVDLKTVYGHAEELGEPLGRPGSEPYWAGGENATSLMKRSRIAS
jgi:hypothetical protein